MPRRRPAPDQPDPAAWSPRDILIPYVLLALSLQRAHGYVIEEYLRGLGFLGLEMSTLYRTLRQLEKDGLLLSTWEPGPTGPARRVYSLTDFGRGWLDTWAHTLDGYRRMLDSFFGLYAGAVARPARSQDSRAEDAALPRIRSRRPKDDSPARAEDAASPRMRSRRPKEDSPARAEDAASPRMRSKRPKEDSPA